MEGKIKSQYIGLLMIFIMFFSTFAFAVINSFSPQDQQPQNTHQPEKEIDRHLKRPLTENEKASLLQQGAAILEFSHTKNCLKCDDFRPILENFYVKYENILFVDIEGDQDTIQFIGKETKVIINVTDADLLDAYCKVSAIQPKECILKNV